MQIVKVEAPAGLATEQVNAVQEAFKPHFEAMGELEERYKALTDIKLAEPTKEQAKEARTVRLALVKTRTGTKDVHKTLKADALVFGRYLDGMKKAQEIACTERETALMEIEKYAENLELERIANLTAERERLLSAVGVEVFPAKLGEMEESVWEVYYDGAYQDKKRRDEAERVAEAERIVREKAEAEERERVQKENDRLKAEAAERIRKEAEAQAERDRIERERIEKEAEERRVIEENARKEREEAQKKLDAERAERERLEAIERERVAAEEKAAAEKKAADEAEAKRVADESHRCKVTTGLAERFVKLGAEPALAMKIVSAIDDGKIPHVSINY